MVVKDIVSAPVAGAQPRTARCFPLMLILIVVMSFAVVLAIRAAWRDER